MRNHLLGLASLVHQLSPGFQPRLIRTQEWEVILLLAGLEGHRVDLGVVVPAVEEAAVQVVGLEVAEVADHSVPRTTCAYGS